MLSRRGICCCGLATLVAISSGRTGSAAPPLSIGGCAQLDVDGQRAVATLWAGDPPKLEAQLSSGDSRIDRSFGALLADIAARFRVRPGFAFYDDSAGPNALALPTTFFPGTTGTVLFGKTLLGLGLGLADPEELLVVSVCAHEFGHVVQNSTSLHNRLAIGQATARLLELHADFLAGFYLAVRGSEYRPQQMVELGQNWEKLGDSNYTNPQHHGEPIERLRAIEQGFLVGSGRPNLGPLDICEIGARYLDA
jgi:hypothetical protein